MTESKQENTSKPEINLSGLPLFYKRPVPIDISRHINSCIITESNFSFARDTNSIPLNTIEFIEAAKTYPIVFTNAENPLPVAVVGLEQTNYFIRPDNDWQEGAYIPAYIRQYPFIFLENSGEKKFYLCIDEESPQFSATQKNEATPIYTIKNQPSELTSNALKFCTAFYQHHMITRGFCADLKEHNLLQPYESEMTLSSGRKVKLSGFQMIDEKALNNLSNKAYLALRDKGWIPFIYFSLSSVSNWKKLIEIEAKYRVTEKP